MNLLYEIEPLSNEKVSKMYVTLKPKANNASMRAVYIVL